MATGSGGPGVRVGSHPYPGSNTGGCSPRPCVPWMQVVVLDRASLSPISNTVYTCPRPNQHGETVCPVDQIQADLAKLNDSDLVIAVSQPHYLDVGWEWLHLLGPIGAPASSDSGSGCSIKSYEDVCPAGLISVVGVPGLAPGQADVKLAIGDPSAKPGDGMVGYLTPDQNDNYGWAPAERVHFDTRAALAGATSGGVRNVIQVGDRRLQQTLPGNAKGGFGVVLLDSYSLTVRAERTFVVSDAQSAAANARSMRDMNAFLGATKATDVVLISSIGRASVQAGPWEVVPAWSDLAGAIEHVGGTRHVFNSSLLHAVPYSLVGWGGAGATHGEEASPVILSQEAAARLRGSLTTDSESLFRPRGVSPLTSPNDALVQELLKPPSTDWPLDNDPRAKKALSYLGSLDNKLGPDPRTAYVNSLDWDEIIGTIRAAKYPGPGHGFSSADFDKAQQELVKEMGWVANVRKYLSNLQQPWDSNIFGSWAQLQDIATKIQNAANVKPDQTVVSLVLDVVGGILFMTPFGVEARGAELAAEAVAETYAVAVEYWSQNKDGSSQNVITDRAADLGVDLTERFQRAQAWSWNMGNVIVTDPAKLQTVGTLANCNPDENPSCPLEWSWTPAARTKASKSLALGLERSFYEELVPLGFPAYRVDPAATSSEQADDPSVDFGNPPPISQFYCGDIGRRFPFRDEPAGGAVSLLTVTAGWDLNVRTVATYVFYALGSPKIDATQPVPPKPPAWIVQRMFDPVDPGGDLNKGGLGIYRPYFMLNADVRSYGPHDPFGSNCSWLP